MHVIHPARIDEYARKYRNASRPLRQWLADAQAARWRNITDVRRAYPNADAARVSSGATVTIFDIKGNHYRLIVSIHYNRQRLYIRDFLTHAEYDKNTWKGRH